MKHTWWKSKEVIGDRVVIGMGSFTLTQGWSTFPTLQLGFQICLKNHLKNIHEQYVSCHDLCSPKLLKGRTTTIVIDDNLWI